MFFDLFVSRRLLFEIKKKYIYILKIELNKNIFICCIYHIIAKNLPKKNVLKKSFGIIYVKI